MRRQSSVFTLALIAQLALLPLAGCSTAGDVMEDHRDTAAAEAEAASEASHAGTPDQPSAALAAALGAPERTDDDRARDARDRPAEVLALAGFGPGDTVADIFGGGGYYSEILSGVVGADGQVLLINNPAYDAFAKQGLGPRFTGNRLPNVRYGIVPNTALGLGEATLDGALIVMSYHDLYYVDPDNGWEAIDARQFIGQIVTALKPGGRLVVVSFHSLEDRIVKNFLSARGKRAGGSRHLPDVEQDEPSFEILTRRPVTPGHDEIAANPRARSAKLRAAQRTGAPAQTDHETFGWPSLSAVMRGG